MSCVTISPRRRYVLDTAPVADEVAREVAAKFPGATAH